ncbi:hypothetical protein GCK72_005018 [Caenorhabditis remanei]|uniref:Uncharacterized protein n=1 Tax=Caenorhabditis remanei TaxID=31234 RepID=A0A6A5HD31_CAERE|nr:hypothetical protein GCK72_005018 [Caenorhabditis remanei]KAF1765067.1 hypothetical protein GCK72_005018 [Caenorhabditis remanei]
MLNRRQTSFPKAPVSLPTTSRYRVHSAPPTSDGRTPLSGGRLPPIVKNRSVERGSLYMDKPSTPDPEQVRRVLEQRIAQALSGPSSRLKQQQMSSDEKQLSMGRRRSLIRSAAIGSEEMHLVPVDDEEMAMLRSINRSQYSKGSIGEGSTSESFTSDALYKHEYEDKSSDDDRDLAPGEQLRTKRKLSMVRQEEQEELNASMDGMNLGGIQSRRESGIRNLEDRLTGMRHEKMRSSTKSGEMGDDQISGLVYDKEFDCYYNPNTDRYYRLKSQSKSGEGLILEPREV